MDFKLKLLCQLLVLSLVSGSTLMDINKLLSDKKANYNKLVRPIFDQSNNMNLVIHFEFLSIQEFDEVGETISIVGHFILAWIDQVMAWNPTEYGNLTSITVESSEFWKPHLVLVNSAGKFETVGNDWLPIRFKNKGLAVFTPGNIFKATCSVDVTYYPWDKQTCSLIFVPWGFNYNEISFSPITNKIGLRMAGEHGVWDISDTNTFLDKDENYAPRYHCQFKFRRNSGFVVLNVLLPVALMSVLNILIFLIPTESGERFSYCLTVLLAIAVFMTLIGENLPKRSSPMSLLSYYLFGVLLNSVAIVLATVGSYRVYCRDTDIPVTPALAGLVRLCGCACQSAKRHTTTPRLDGKRTKIPESSKEKVSRRDFSKQEDLEDSINNHVQALPSDISNTLEEREITLTEEKHDIDVVSWKQVARSLDNLFFLSFSLILIGTTTSFLMLIYFGNDRI